MKKLIVLFFFGIQIIQAQSKYFIFFTDKEGVDFDPYAYFDTKAIDRRIKENINLFDTTDFPVNENYISNMNRNCDSIGIISRWFNGMSVYATNEQIEFIKLFSFVKKIQLMESQRFICSDEEATFLASKELSDDQLNLLLYQTSRHQAAFFSENNLHGKGIRIAIFDIGFPNVDTHPAFEKLRSENRIIDTYDFVSNKKNVYHGMSHGTACLSCIAGYYGEVPMGMATESEFLLARTERRFTEFESEEDKWLAAAEWADKNGADIISSSLAYTKERYTPADMTGDISIVSKAAKMATDKGIFVLNAAGNEADKVWEYIATPADVETVLTVGGTDPYSDAHISFSSFGPNAKGNLKPNVSAVGEAITASKNNYMNSFGTSFSTPIVAGFVACVWQHDTTLTREALFIKIEQSCHLFPYADYAHGYGIPQANYIINPRPRIKQTFETKFENKDTYTIQIKIDSTFYPTGDFIEYKQYNFYYQFTDVDDRIVQFGVLVPDDSEFNIEIPEQVVENLAAYKFRGHFEGYTFTFSLN